jgi:hypothetical protein
MNNGFIFWCAYANNINIEFGKHRRIIDGVSFDLTVASATAMNMLRNYAYGSKSTVSNNFIYTSSTQTSQKGLVVRGYACSVFNNIVHGFSGTAGIGIEAGTYNNDMSNIYNNSVSGCTTNWYLASGGSENRGFWENNIGIGGTTNWGTEPNEIQSGAYNAGESGNSPWETGSATSLVMATTDFYDYSGHNFSPAAKSSPQVGTGLVVYEGSEFDILGKIRPAMIDITHTFDYDNEADGPFAVWNLLSWGSDGTAGTGRLVELTDAGTTGTMGVHLISGVAPTDDTEITNGTATCDVNGSVTEGEEWVPSASWSAGAIEYDYGGPQAIVTLTIGPVDSDTEIRIMETGTDTEITGIEQVGVSGYWDYEYAYSGTPIGVDINILHESKKNIRLVNLSLGAADQSIYVSQETDRSYENPA